MDLKAGASLNPAFSDGNLQPSLLETLSHDHLISCKKLPILHQEEATVSRAWRIRPAAVCPDYPAHSDRFPHHPPRR